MSESKVCQNCGREGKEFFDKKTNGLEEHHVFLKSMEEFKVIKSYSINKVLLCRVCHLSMHDKTMQHSSKIGIQLQNKLLDYLGVDVSDLVSEILSGKYDNVKSDVYF